MTKAANKAIYTALRSRTLKLRSIESARFSLMKNKNFGVDFMRKIKADFNEALFIHCAYIDHSSTVGAEYALFAVNQQGNENPRPVI